MKADITTRIVMGTAIHAMTMATTGSIRADPQAGDKPLIPQQLRSSVVMVLPRPYTRDI